jgi:glycosyltransferase involved in cell wall biosynthesis
MESPLVSIGIPLYRSARFVETIARNVEAIDLPGVEILFSDCHRHDDALEQIAARFPGDRRLRFSAASDQVGWTENYNRLLRMATGKYFMWMSHDDEYPPGFVAALVECLEREPGTILAYGRMELVDDLGRELGRPAADVLTREDEPWTVEAALRQLILRSNHSLQTKGLFRREPVVRRGLYVRRSLDTVWADVYWAFAIDLLGRPRHVPSVALKKRLHGASVSAGWSQLRLRDVASGWSVLASYIRDFGPSPAGKGEAIAVVSLWSLARAVAAAPASWPVPLRGRAVARKLLGRALSAPDTALP